MLRNTTPCAIVCVGGMYVQGKAVGQDVPRPGVGVPWCLCVSVWGDVVPRQDACLLA